MRILISAYACEPGAGSEPGAGWTWARAAALDHDVWLLTRENNGPAIEAALVTEPDLRLTPVYLDLPAWARFWKRGPLGTGVYYVLWQILVRREAVRIHRRERMDVAHHLTFAVDSMPAGAVGIEGLPSVWGPVGGASDPPWRFWRWLGLRGVKQEVVRETALRFLRWRIGERVARRAALVVAQNAEVADRFRRVAPHVVVSPHPALDLDALNALGPQRAWDGPGRRRAVFVARLAPWKGATLAVAAMAEPSASGWELHVFGDGPDRARARRSSEMLGVSDRVTFHGLRPRTEVLRAIRDADALLFPSIHDAAGWAVAEAVAFGTPVVCLDRGGPPIIAAGASKIRVGRSANDLPARIAEGLQAIDGREEPDPRWSADAVPGRLREWYSFVTSSSADAAPGAGR